MIEILFEECDGPFPRRLSRLRSAPRRELSLFRPCEATVITFPTAPYPLVFDSKGHGVRLLYAYAALFPPFLVFGAVLVFRAPLSGSSRASMPTSTYRCRIVLSYILACCLNGCPVLVWA